MSAESSSPTRPAAHPMQATVALRAERRKQFGSWLSATLLAQQVSTTSLAAQLGTSERKVRGWCDGDAIPYLATLGSISQALQVPLSEVLSAAGKASEGVRVRYASAPDEAFPSVLRRWRQEAGLSTTDAGTRSRVGQSSWSRYESGSAVPGKVHLLRISDFTGIDASVLAASARTAADVPEALDEAVEGATRPLPQLVRTAAEAKRLSTEELAALVDVAPATLSGWLRAKSVPQLRNLRSLSAALDVPLVALLVATGLSQEAAQRLEAATQAPLAKGAFGDVVRAARSARGLTMEVAAQEVGCSRFELLRYEKGQRLPHSLDRIDRIASVLGAELPALLVAAGQVDPS